MAFAWDFPCRLFSLLWILVRLVFLSPPAALPALPSVDAVSPSSPVEVPPVPTVEAEVSPAEPLPALPTVPLESEADPVPTVCCSALALKMLRHKRR